MSFYAHKISLEMFDISQITDHIIYQIKKTILGNEYNAYNLQQHNNFTSQT